VECQNIAIEYRYAEGKVERLPDLAAELVRLRVDLIVASNTPAALAAKQATPTLPIVMALSGDAVESGLVGQASARACVCATRKLPRDRPPTTAPRRNASRYASMR
jgi:ABC-type uncharacterized transport system substrate-binding protein